LKVHSPHMLRCLMVSMSTSGFFILEIYTFYGEKEKNLYYVPVGICGIKEKS
jgi:hypothetical protein